MTARAALLAACAIAAFVPPTRALAAQIEVCFSPPLPGGCDPAGAIEGAVRAARKSDPHPGVRDNSRAASRCPGRGA